MFVCLFNYIYIFSRCSLRVGMELEHHDYTEGDS